MRHIQRSSRTLVAGAIGVLLLAAVAIASLTATGQAAPGVTQAQTGPPPPGRERATFAAGCFWSMEAIFSQLKGVERVDSGYAGGTWPHPSYEQVETGATGYAESVNITYDPKVISYRELLRVLLTTRDPTSLNRQGPDEGPQYRSAIFFRSPAQRQAAEVAIHMAQSRWSRPIVTQVVPFTTFYHAEDYHTNYYRLHPDEPYCAQVIAPEIASFREQFKSELKN